MAGAVPVVSGVAERGALDRLATASALHGRGVHEQQIIVETGALTGEHLHQPLQCLSEATSALEVSGLPGQSGKQVAQALGRDREEASVRWDTHDRLRDAERHDLRVCDATSGVLGSFGQEIVSRHENGSEQQVEVGVHRGPLWSAMLQSRGCPVVCVGMS
jgi:hypothetical protein